MLVARGGREDKILANRAAIERVACGEHMETVDKDIVIGVWPGLWCWFSRPSVHQRRLLDLDPFWSRARGTRRDVLEVELQRWLPWLSSQR